MLSKHRLLFPVLLLLNNLLIGQVTHSIMTYNLLNYPGTNSNERNPDYSTTISSVDPDVIVVQEVTSQVSINFYSLKCGGIVLNNKMILIK